MSVPTSDAALVPYVNNFYSRGNSAPADFGYVAAQMTQLGTLRTAYIDLMDAIAEGARSKALVADKNLAKANLLAYLRELYAFCAANTTVTPGNKELIGVVVRSDEPSPVPPVALAPVVAVKSVSNRIVRGTLRDATTESSRRKPLNAAGALILIAHGPTPPVSKSGWTVAGQTGRTTWVTEVPADVQPGEPCYITAMWYNERGEYSPAADPITTYLQIGPATEVA
jgi:hypothetical protein